MLPIEVIDDVSIIRPVGRFDAYQVAEIDETMETLFADNDIPRIIINFMDIIFIDSGALDALMRWLDIAHERGGDIKLSCLRNTVRMRLNVTNLTKFAIHEDDPAAIEAFKLDK